MDKNKKLIIIIILLIVIIGGVSFFAFYQVQENKEMTELFAIEKEEMENEYTTYATQYDELQVQINNDSLREKLASEQLRTQRLLEELRQVKTSNAAEIMRLKKELKTVRAVLRSYVMQIDSLNKINEALTTENKEVKKKYSEATRQINTLAKEKKNLNEKVTLAAQLDATNFVIEPKNKRGKVVNKVKNVKKIAVSFHREEHHRQDRRTYLIYTHRQPEQRGAEQERIGYLHLRKPPADILHQEVHRIYGRRTDRHRILGRRRVPSGRYLSGICLCRRNDDRATIIQYEIKKRGQSPSFFFINTTPNLPSSPIFLPFILFLLYFLYIQSL